MVLQAGTTALINTTLDYPLTQEWARAFHAHPSGLDGIFHVASRAQEQRSIALFDRAFGKLGPCTTTPFKTHRDLLEGLWDYFGIVLVS